MSSLVAVGLSFVLIFLMMPFDPELQTSGQDLLYSALYSFFFGCFYGSIITPLYLRYGTEKARVFIFAIMGILAMVIILLQKTGVLDNLESSEFIDSVAAFNPLQITSLSIAMLGVSTIVSRRFIEKSVAF